MLSIVGAAFAAAPATAGPSFFVGLDDGSSTFVSKRAFVSDLNVGALRVPLAWQRGRAEPTADDLSALQAVVTAHPDARILLVANGLGDDAPTDPVARDQYCAFLRTLLARFPTINDVVVWNEPNLSFFWKPQFHPDGTSAAPAAYLQLLARCWDVLHAFRPGVNVLGPATSPRGNDNPNAVSNISHSPLNFIRKLGDAYRASGRAERVLDTVAHHVYGSTPAERPWRTHTGTQISEGDWAKLMQAYRDAFQGTPQAIPGECVPGGCVWIWYTEAGYQTIVDEQKLGVYHGTESIVRVIPDYAGSEPDWPPPAATSLAPDQWTQIIDGVRLAACQPYVQAFFNFLLVDVPDLASWQSGFLWADGTPKDSYPAFRRVIAEASEDRVDCSALKGGAVPSPDTVPPAAPTSLAARRDDGRVSLAWVASSEADVMGYNVYRAGPGRPYERLNGTLVGSLEYIDSAPPGESDSWYAVTAVDTAENESEPSNEACAPEAGAPCEAARPESAPSAVLTSPPEGALVRGNVELRASADDDIGVARVEFLARGAVVASDSTAPYSAIWSTTSAADGPTTVAARAVDGWGNTAVASRTITVDNTPPSVEVTSGPTGIVASSEAAFEFAADEAVRGFECALDAEAFAACSSPATYAGLPDGSHSFRVRATDAAGNVGAPASRSWTVEPPASPPPSPNPPGPIPPPPPIPEPPAAALPPQPPTVAEPGFAPPGALILRGTPGNDVLVGTAGSDVIYGFGGRDVIRGRGGNDTVFGGPGDDRVEGGLGNDRLFGGPGRDTLAGGRGDDMLRGGRGKDRMLGNRGRDLIDALDRGRDFVDGGPHRDRARGDRRLDTVHRVETLL